VHLFLYASILAVAGNSAAPVAPLRNSGESAASNIEETIKCKSVQLVHSRIPTKICQTEAEWEAERQKQIDDRRSRRSRVSSCGSEGLCR